MASATQDPQTSQSSADGLPPYQKPPAGPTADSVHDRDRWEELTDQSLPSVQAAAEKWRTGLAAFITLVTAGLFVKGPAAASDMTTSWRAVITAFSACGLLSAIAGLWLALQAAAGTPARINLSQITAKYGGVRQFEVACALIASGRLRWARALVAIALVLLVSAAITWWWAPPLPPQPPAMVSIDTPSGTVCGTLDSADNHAFRVQVAGNSSPTRIPYAAARNVRVVASC